jgi:hypothetical protein
MEYFGFGFHGLDGPYGLDGLGGVETRPYFN